MSETWNQTLIFFFVPIKYRKISIAGNQCVLGLLLFSDQKDSDSNSYFCYFQIICFVSLKFSYSYLCLETLHIGYILLLLLNETKYFFVDFVYFLKWTVT